MSEDYDNTMNVLREMMKKDSSDYIEKVFVLLDNILGFKKLNIKIEVENKKDLAKVYYSGLQIAKTLIKKDKKLSLPGRFKKPIFPEYKFEYTNYWSKNRELFFETSSSISYKNIDKFLKESGLNALTYIAKNTKKNNKNVSKVQNEIFSLSFTDSGYLLINNKFIVKKPNFESVNYRIIDFLINKAKKVTYSIRDIAKEIKEENGIDRNIHQIVRDLGFVGEFIGAFVKKAKNKISIRKSIEVKDFQKNGIDYKSFLKQIRKLKHK